MKSSPMAAYLLFTKSISRNTEVGPLETFHLLRDRTDRRGVV